MGISSMAVDPLCGAAKAISHSAPSLHWWLSLTATDQGTWFAGIGTFFAAVVALGIALSEGWRRKREQRARARLTMASLYTPMVGVMAMVMGLGEDTMVAIRALPGSSVKNVVAYVERMKNGCDVMRPLLEAFNASEAVHLSGDHGVALAAAVRDAELMIALVASVTEKYLPGIESTDYEGLYKLLQSLKRVPSQAAAIKVRMSPFLDACKRELGFLEDGESLSDTQGKI
jgi:hypothetical protein